MGCCRVRLVQEVASRTSRRRWQMRLFFRVISFFFTGQKGEFGVVWLVFLGMGGE